MKCSYYFHLHYQIRNLYVFFRRGVSTMCPGIGSSTSSLTFIKYGVKVLSNFMKIIYDWKCFDRSVLHPKYFNTFDIAKIYFPIVLISVDHASVSWFFFFKILKIWSVPLEVNYLAIVSSFYLPPLC